MTYDVDSMRVKFAIAKMMFSIFVNIIVSFLHQKSTRIYIRNVKTFLMFTNQCFSQRSFNKKRRLTSIIIQFIDDRERSEKNDQIDESIDNRVEIVVVFSLFLFQKKNHFDLNNMTIMTISILISKSNDSLLSFRMLFLSQRKQKSQKINFRKLIKIEFQHHDLVS